MGHDPRHQCLNFPKGKNRRDIPIGLFRLSAGQGVRWTRWFGNLPIDPDLRLCKVDLVSPDHAIAMGIGTGTPEKGFVFEWAKDLTLEKRLAVDLSQPFKLTSRVLPGLGSLA
jgi:hypothetical protein